MKEGNPMSNEAINHHSADDPSLWWKQAVVYQVYPRSFKDTTGSGLGDIAGVAQQIPYLKRLGVDAIWLSPFYPSQLADGGYDVDDYRNVDPKLGTMDDFDHLTKTAHAAGIKIVVDIVPNHSSNQHEWFKAALAAGPGSPERDRYIFRDGKGPNGDEPPTNWIASFGGSAWTRVPDGQWYLHMFTVEQPDWNWKNPDVRADFIKTLHFWLDHGADGFRVDVAHGLAKDLDRDDLDDFKIIGGEMHCADGTHPLYDRNEVHDIYREWRKVFNEYDPPAFAVAEAWVPPEHQYRYASPEELGQVFNFEFAKKDWIRNDMHLAIEEGIAAAERSGSTSTWVMSNHDIPRHVSRYGLPQVPAAAHHQLAKDWLLRNGTSYHEDRELGTKRARAAILMELALPGSAYIYQGEELGLPEVADIPWDELEDPTAFNRVRDQIEKGRDGCRVPLPWKAGTPTFGFSPATKHEGAGVDASQAGDPCEKPHLPQPQWFADYAVDREDTDSGSMLNLYRKALGLRHEWMTADTTLTWLDCDRSSGKPDGAEWYGIIYNKKIIKDYCAKSYAVIKSADDIKDYKTLKQVAESIEQHKDDLGVDGAFATPGLDTSDTYRFAAHMTRLPLYYEYRDANTTFSKTIKGTYLKNYKDMFDLQLKTSPTEASMVSSKTYDDVTSEFALGQVAFYPNGVWAYSQIKGNDVADEDLGMLPYYMGIKGEEDCGPVGVYDASWAVNKNASEKDKKATLDFIKWMITDNEAKKILSKDMGFSVPFTTFTDDYQPDNPLTEAARAYSNDGKTEVRSFTIPDQQWQDDIASALVEYTQGTGKWDKVQSAFVDGWSTEWNNNEESLGSVPEAQKFDAKS